MEFWDGNNSDQSASVTNRRQIQWYVSWISESIGYNYRNVWPIHMIILLARRNINISRLEKNYYWQIMIMYKRDWSIVKRINESPINTADMCTTSPSHTTIECHPIGIFQCCHSWLVHECRVSTFIRMNCYGSYLAIDDPEMLLETSINIVLNQWLS